MDAIVPESRQTVSLSLSDRWRRHVLISRALPMMARFTMPAVPRSARSHGRRPPCGDGGPVLQDPVASCPG